MPLQTVIGIFCSQVLFRALGAFRYVVIDQSSSPSHRVYMLYFASRRLPSVDKAVAIERSVVLIRLPIR